MIRDTAAIAGGLLATFSTVPYIIDIIRRRTKPNIVSWFTWTLLTGIALAASIAAHETKIFTNDLLKLACHKEKYIQLNCFLHKYNI